MQPIDRPHPHPHRQRPHHQPPPLPGLTDEDRSALPALGTGPPFGGPRIRVAGPAVLVQASFRDLTLASRLLRAGEPGTFTIGTARGTDAPVNPVWLPEPAAPSVPVRHVLVEAIGQGRDGRQGAGGGFALNLSPAMRAELRTPLQRLSLAPDFGQAEAPLVLPPESFLSITCGEMVFELRLADPVAALPRPWLATGWRELAAYGLVVALAFLATVALAYLVPADPRALSLDDIDVSHRLTAWVTLPPEAKPPQLDRALDWLKPPGGAQSAAAAGPTGQAGSRKAPPIDGRRAVKGQPSPTDARALAARIHDSSLLAVLDGPHAGSLLAGLVDGPALGTDAADVLGHMVGATIADAYGRGGIGVLGTGAGGGGLGDGLVGLGHIGTNGRFGTGNGNGNGNGNGDGPGYGTAVGQLATRRASVPDAIPGIGDVRGSLDKEIIRRIIRRHLNEVRYCYEQGLASHPSLNGRLVVQFTIAPTGRVLASALQSSSLGVVSVDACVVQAVKRWEFPQPSGGGLVMVSYPFQLTPGG